MIGVIAGEKNEIEPGQMRVGCRNDRPQATRSFPVVDGIDMKIADVKPGYRVAHG